MRRGPLARLSHGFTSRSAVVILRPFMALRRGIVAVDRCRSSASGCDNGLAGSARKVNLSGGTRHLINSRPTMEEPFVVLAESYLQFDARVRLTSVRVNGLRLRH